MTYSTSRLPLESTSEKRDRNAHMRTFKSVAVKLLSSSWVHFISIETNTS
jgi:hypothetical protein